MTSYNPIYYQQNRKQKLAAQTKYQQSPEGKKKVNAKQRRYYAKHRLEISQRRKEKYKKDKYKKITIIHDMDEAAYGDKKIQKNKETK